MLFGVEDLASLRSVARLADRVDSLLRAVDLVLKIGVPAGLVGVLIRLLMQVVSSSNKMLSGMLTLSLEFVSSGDDLFSWLVALSLEFVTSGDKLGSWFMALSLQPVSYTHLTLPTICSV